jgi:RNA polymerase sigma-70 factor (ECF subfamily)
MGYTTKKSLLAAIQNGDEISWFEFYETYRPLIILRGNDYRLSSTELDDLCQSVLLDIFKMGKRFRYDPAKGRFRDYLRRVISHNAIDLIRKRKDRECACTEFPGNLTDMNEAHWQEEWQAHILSQALVILREQVEIGTFQVFELYAIKGEPPEKVARFLGISVSAVYVAKSRAVAKLRKIVEQLREE